MKRLGHALSISNKRPSLSKPFWRKPPLRRYRQLWSQLKIVDGVICREYAPGPTSEIIQVPLIPDSERPTILQSNHNSPTPGHQGIDKTLNRIRQVAYWVNMAQDVDKHCRECTQCQQAKLSLPQRASITNIPIGRPWQMIAVDILEVPVSLHNNRYLLVVQDYFTKWAAAIPMKDQTVEHITTELVNFFSLFGMPEIVHSDQGRNFESTILRQTLQAFDTDKTRTTAYHPQCDGMVERFNRSLLQLLRTYVDKQWDWERHLPLVLYAYRSAVHSSTGISPFYLMFGRHPKLPASSPNCNAFDVRWQSYRTLWTLMLHNQQSTKRDCMTDIPKQDYFMKVILFGCLFLLLGS